MNQAQSQINRVTALVADARYLARREPGKVCPILEPARLAVLDALFAFVDGETTLAELLTAAAPLTTELARPQARQLVSALKAEAYERLAR